MKSQIQKNGLTDKSIYKLFPMVYAINSDGNTAEVEHDSPLVFPPDDLVAAQLVDQARDAIRDERVALLAEADWRILRAEDQSEDTSAMRAYRQALRDITNQADPNNIKWPGKPWDAGV